MGVRTMSKRKQHNEEFKREAVRLMQSRGERTVEQVADDVGVSAGQLYKWRERLGRVGPAKGGVSHDELLHENQRLKRENDRLRQERELLKKSMAKSIGQGNRPRNSLLAKDTQASCVVAR